MRGPLSADQTNRWRFSGWCQQTWQRALAEIAGVDAKVVAERMMAMWIPARLGRRLSRLIEPARAEGSSGQHDAATAGDGDTSKLVVWPTHPFSWRMRCRLPQRNLTAYWAR